MRRVRKKNRGKKRKNLIKVVVRGQKGNEDWCKGEVCAVTGPAHAGEGAECKRAPLHLRRPEKIIKVVFKRSLFPVARVRRPSQGKNNKGHLPLSTGSMREAPSSERSHRQNERPFLAGEKKKHSKNTTVFVKITSLR